MHELLGKFDQIARKNGQPNGEPAGISTETISSLRTPINVSLLRERLEKVDRLVEEAKIDRRRGALDDSTAKLREAIDTYQRLVSPVHHKLGPLLNELGLTLMQQESFAEAEMAFKGALAVVERTLPETHPGRIVYLKNYASLLEKTNRKAVSDKLMKMVEILKAV